MRPGCLLRMCLSDLLTHASCEPSDILLLNRSDAVFQGIQEPIMSMISASTTVPILKIVVPAATTKSALQSPMVLPSAMLGKLGPFYFQCIARS